MHRFPGSRPPRRDPRPRQATRHQARLAAHTKGPSRCPPTNLNTNFDAPSPSRAEYQHPEQARQRLLQRNYRPGSGHRQLAAGITAAAAAGSVVLGLGLSGAFGSSPAHGTGTIRTTAFTITRNANGTATLTINPKVLFDPSTLQSDLAQYGIPARVTTASFCSSDPAPVASHRS